MTHKLRDYQNQAIDEIRKNFIAGNRKVLLHLDTGAGKTTVFSEILKRTAEKGKRCAMVVRGRHLVDQASQRLYRENVFHGVIMANHWNKKPHAPIQICSIDTIFKRKSLPKFDLIVYDEAHLLTSEKSVKFSESYPDAFHLAVTATPFTEKSLKHMAENVVRPIDFQGLVDRGYLVPPVYYAPSVPDLSGVKVSSTTKDFQVGELAEFMERSAIVGDIISSYKEFGENRPAVLFAVNIAHSKAMAAHLNQAGIPAAHLDADTPLEERKELIAKLSVGELQVLTNVGVLCLGVDMPPVSCIIMARPTKSYNLYVQQVGRGSRPFDNKNDFLILDHAANTLRHGFVEDMPPVDLDTQPKAMGGLKTRTCEQCFAVYDYTKHKQCPQCGHVNVKEERLPREIEQLRGKLKPLTKEQRIEIDVARLKKIRRERGYKRGWLYYQLKEKYGDAIADKYCPKRSVPPWVAGQRPYTSS